MKVLRFEPFSHGGKNMGTFHDVGCRALDTVKAEIERSI